MSSRPPTRRSNSVWAAIYRRRGGRGNRTGIFDELSQEDRRFILARSAIQTTQELPVLASIPNSSAWSLLTTERLIWTHGHEIRSTLLDEIRNVKVDLARLQTIGTQKNENQRIEITTTDGIQDFIEVEPGPPLNGFFSVLMHICRRSTH